MSYVFKFLKWPREEKQLFIAALFWIGCYLCIVYLLPAKMLKYFLGEPIKDANNSYLQNEQSAKLNASAMMVRLSMSRAIRCWRIPNICLVYALSAKRLLQKRKTPSRLYLGVVKKDARINAHAWLVCGDIDIVGYEQKQNYTIIGIFEG